MATEDAETTFFEGDYERIKDGKLCATLKCPFKKGI